MIERTQEEIMKNWNVDNTDNPLVSVRCITYNHESYIAQALDSFLMQKTTFSFEVIVHDDASTDKTAEIIREYEIKFPKIIKPIYEKENQYSKNDGSISRIMHDACQGKYIALCEGDDYWIDENKLQIQVDFLEKNLDYSMCFHNAIQHYEDGSQPDKKFSEIRNREYKGKEFLYKWIIPTASVVCRKKYMEYYLDLCQDKRFIYGDTILFLSLAREGKIFGMSSIMSIYRRQETGIVYKYSSARNYKQHFHNVAIRDHFPEVRFVATILIIKKDASWCAKCILKKDYEYAKLFFKIDPISIIIFVPFLLIKWRIKKIFSNVINSKK